MLIENTMKLKDREREYVVKFLIHYLCITENAMKRRLSHAYDFGEATLYRSWMAGLYQFVHL